MRHYLLNWFALLLCSTFTAIQAQETASDTLLYADTNALIQSYGFSHRNS